MAGKKFCSLVHLPAANTHEVEIASFLQLIEINNFLDLPWLAGNVTTFTLFSMVMEHYRVQMAPGFGSSKRGTAHSHQQIYC